MAKSIVQNPGDVFLHLQQDEYNALLALLSEFENSEKLKELSQRERLEITPQQCERLALLWGQLVQHKS